MQPATVVGEVAAPDLTSCIAMNFTLPQKEAILPTLLYLSRALVLLTHSMHIVSIPLCVAIIIDR